MKTSRIVIALALTCGTMTHANRTASACEHGEAHAPEVGMDELSALVKTKGALIIDANSAASYRDGHIPGAISFAAHEKDLAKVLPQDKSALIVAYCGGPMCMAWQDAAKEATKLGYTNIKHFKGGLKTWKDAGRPLEKAKS